ncbi:MAG: class B sortase [Oscillospiraceae bacterium]|nr:class B sortase [Oscillospiraceae bacterium]
MDNNENKDMLSFDELRKKLGMDEDEGKKEIIDFDALQNGGEPTTDLKSSSADSFGDDIAAQIEKTLEEAANSEDGPTVVTENGKTFVDITSQYVKKQEPSAGTVGESKPVKTKKVRTFNEIFSDFFKAFIPLGKDSTKEKVRKIVMDISIIAIIGCAIAFGELFRQYRAELKAEEDLKNKFVATEDMEENQYEQAWEELFAQYPKIQVPEGMNLKYAYLYAMNQDLAGWLKIGNTNLDVQVVQSKDNDFYLRRDFYKKSSRYGCPYLDYRNNAKDLDDNTVIYGHHMPDGLMFSNLDRYKTLEGYKEAPVIEFNTLYDTYYFKVFAAFVTNAQTDEDDGYIFNFTVTDFSTEEKFISFIEEVRLRSIINTDITVQPDDRLITLVTCTYDFNEARLVVMGRMVRENEDLSVDTGTVSLNPSPRYPQAWYDAKGLENPYIDTEKWTAN